jgi:hypothetical protein
MDNWQPEFKWSAAAIVMACALQRLAGCSRPDVEGATAPTPVLIASGADFGRIPSNSSSVTKEITVTNGSSVGMHVSHWTTSCDCLSIQPRFLDIPAGSSATVWLSFEPGNDGDKFEGDLQIEVEAWRELARVGTFDVAVSVVAANHGSITGTDRRGSPTCPEAEEPAQVTLDGSVPTDAER